MKWYGLFHRKATPGFFMLRLRIPNGVLSSEQIECEQQSREHDRDLNDAQHQILEERVPFREDARTLPTTEKGGEHRECDQHEDREDDEGERSDKPGRVPSNAVHRRLQPTAQLRRLGDLVADEDDPGLGARELHRLRRGLPPGRGAAQIDHAGLDVDLDPLERRDTVEYALKQHPRGFVLLGARLRHGLGGRCGLL